jgi:hypothetical protein
VNIKEFAPHMRPAGGLDNAFAGEQLVKPGIAVGVNNTAEVRQMGLWMFALAVRRIAEQSRWRPRTGKRPLVSDVGP